MTALSQARPFGRAPGGGPWVARSQASKVSEVRTSTRRSPRRVATGRHATIPSVCMRPLPAEEQVVNVAEDERPFLGFYRVAYAGEEIAGELTVDRGNPSFGGRGQHPVGQG